MKSENKKAISIRITTILAISLFLTLALTGTASANNTSLLGVKFNVSDFSFASDSYVQGAKVSFNTSALDTNLTLMTTMNVLKKTGAGTNEVWIRVKVDGVVKLEEKLRTVEMVHDEGSTGTKLFIFNVSYGEHNISIEFKRTGRGSININDIDLNLGQFITAHEYSVRGTLRSVNTTFSNTDLAEVFNWTGSKSIASGTYLSGKFTLNATGKTTVLCRFRNRTSNQTSPYVVRYLSDATDVGSVSLSYIESAESESVNFSLDCRSTTGENVTLNGTIINFDMGDEGHNLINNFQISNNNTNYTSTQVYSAGIHNIVNQTLIIRNGTGYFLGMSTSFNSTSVKQTPRYFISATGVSESNCSSNKERYLRACQEIS